MSGKPIGFVKSSEASAYADKQNNKTSVKVSNHLVKQSVKVKNVDTSSFKKSSIEHWTSRKVDKPYRKKFIY